MAFFPEKSANQMKTTFHGGAPVFLKRPVPGSAAGFQGCLMLASSTLDLQDPSGDFSHFWLFFLHKMGSVLSYKEVWTGV